MKRWLWGLMLAVGPVAVAERPNVVLIMADDVGWSDIGCFGGEIATPTLDRLAAGGLRFSQFYNAGRCCPTRAALLTGLHPHQAGIGHMTSDYGLPAYRGHLHAHTPTIAEALKPAGYRAYMTGKWHVTRHERSTSKPDNWPRQRGFDRFYGTITGAGSFYDPTTLCRENTLITPANDPDYRPPTFYYTDAISDNAVRFLADHATQAPAPPFFLYVAYTAAHWPMHALPEDIARYRGKYSAGYGAVRKARVERLKALGLLPDQWQVAPQAGRWDKQADQAWEAACMEVYAAMIDRMDQGIGKIVAELDRQGVLDNTLVMYFQDNGGCAEEMGRQSNADKIAGQTYPALGPDDLQPQIWPPMQTRDGRPVRTGPGVIPGPPDTYIGYGRNWANVSNTPFREYKHWVHEGGIASPLVAHWPRGIRLAEIAADAQVRRRPEGPICDTPCQLIDLMATCLDLAGAKLPVELAGRPTVPPEGVSLAPAFTGRRIVRDRPLCWEHEGNRAVRDGKWKLVAKGVEGPWELYDMEADRTEMHDLAAKHPELVAKYSAVYAGWSARCGVVPFGSWKK